MNLICVFLKAALGGLPWHRGELGPRGGQLGNTFKLEADAFLSLPLFLCRSQKTKRQEGSEGRGKKRETPESGTGFVATSCRKSWTEHVNEGHCNHKRRGSPHCSLCVRVCVCGYLKVQYTLSQIDFIYPLSHYCQNTIYKAQPDCTHNQLHKVSIQVNTLTLDYTLQTYSTSLFHVANRHTQQAHTPPGTRQGFPLSLHLQTVLSRDDCKTLSHTQTHTDTLKHTHTTPCACILGQAMLCWPYTKTNKEQILMVHNSGTQQHAYLL